ncbi:MAG: hypothetical protein LBV72_13350 [Tannerella sp.]|jgi:hypothetical protein|nr:hypothetical protein [Tannerella sp.]
MNTTKCPSRAPRLFGLFLIIFIAPAIFVLGFGANKKHQSTPRKAAVQRIASTESAEITTQKDEPVFIYADAYTVSRNDAIYKVEDAEGNEITATTLHNQRPVVLDGQLFNQFSPVASFKTTGGKVSVYCDTENAARGEFFVGEKVSSLRISWLMLVCFALGILVMVLGLYIAIRNIFARKKWFEEHTV